MIRQILEANDPRLRSVSKKVERIDKKILSLIKDLKETLSFQKDPEGIGLAAPQVGKKLRIFIMKPKSDIRVVINPVIIKINKAAKSVQKRKRIMEGCLSLPNFYSPLERRMTITIKYKNENDQDLLETFTNIEAQIVQHEIDHLNGVLFIDRLIEQKKPLYEYLDGDWEEVELPQ